MICAAGISIHSPLTGRDAQQQGLILTTLSISIHSPLTGRDVRTNSPVQRYPDFNPLSPHGERLSWCKPVELEYGISIHSPLTGRDEVVP